MLKAIAFIKAARLRTLPLSFSATITGSALALFAGIKDITVIVLCLATTLFLQVLSNFANDYGDFVKGTDNRQRVGPSRTLQSGEITKNEMKTAILLVILLSLASGTWLVYEGTKGMGKDDFIFFMVLGLGAIAAAVFYTVGKKAYGYHGMGDVFVFLFFGLVGVTGSFYLQARLFDVWILLPASSIGFFSAGVLNLNNMRDHVNDHASGKNTLVVKMGFEKAKYYHLFLLFAGIIATVIFIMKNYSSPWQFIFLAILPLLFKNGMTVMRSSDPKQLDPLLKQLAITTFLFSLLLGCGLYISTQNL
ncbi:MAG: 1,4-dihydroxy-2-naphthoate polyprenyltransferase [Bacteroidota bacterium]